LSNNKDKIKSSKPQRQYHYVPQSYLANFTDSGKKDGLLWVLDKKELKQWRDIPRKVGYQKDFYRIEIPGIKPNLMEEILKSYENQAAPVVKKIIDTETLPTDNDLIILITMVALMAFRTPHFREIYEKPLKRMGKIISKMMLSNENQWKEIQEGMKKNGYAVGKEIDYEKMKNFVESNNYEIEVNKDFSREFHIQILLKIVEEILPSLMFRKWSLGVTKNKSYEFVCSDSPVSLIWSKPVPGYGAPGFEMENTKVIVPLAKNIVLLGRFEGESHRLFALEKQVACINRLSIIFAQRFIYSSRKNINWLNKDEDIGNTDDLLDELKKGNL